MLQKNISTFFSNIWNSEFKANWEGLELKASPDTIPEWLARHMFGEVDDGIYVVDQNLNIVAVNDLVQQWCKSSGYSDSITGKNVLGAIPFINEMAVSHIKQVLSTSKPLHAEYLWPLEQNRVIVAQIAPLFTPDNSPQAITIARDIGEQKSIIDSIIKRELAARLLLEQVTDGIHIHTMNGQIIYANESLSSQLGYTPDELLRLHPIDFDISADENHFPQIRAEIMTTGHVLYQTSFRAKDGREISTEVNSNQIQYYGESAILSISRDISERRIIISIPEIEIVRNELEKSNRDLELYTSLLQHDLRSDLHVILTQVDQSILESLSNQKEEKSLKVIQAAIERMSKLLDMLESTKEIAEQELANCILAVASVAKKMNPDLQIDIINNSGNELIQVSAGRLLPLVWTNLFRNSVNYVGPDAHVRVTISSEPEKVIVDVADDGPGVPKAIRKRLFEKGASTTGSGYGLYLCRKIVEAYGGTIELVDQECKGALFRVSLRHA